MFSWISSYLIGDAVSSSDNNNVLISATSSVNDTINTSSSSFQEPTPEKDIIRFSALIIGNDVTTQITPVESIMVTNPIAYYVKNDLGKTKTVLE
jgi:hypothetical protein